jgi:hypothetical protein
MTSITGNAPNIAEYPDYCTYCTQKYRSTKCLLPYALASRLVLPKDPIDMTMELTELHCSFKTDSLQHFAELTHWHTSQSDPQSGSVFGPTLNWVVHNDSLSRKMTSTDASTTHSGAPLSENAQTGIAPTEAESTSQVSGPTSNIDIGTDRTSTPTTPVQLKDEIAPATSPLTAQNLEQLSSTQKHPLLPEMTLPDALHLARDAVMAIVTAQNLRKLKRTSSTLSDLQTSVETELNALYRLGGEYKTKSSTKLDHPIAIARELVATHNATSFQSWRFKQQVKDKHPHGCFLNFNRSNPYYLAHPELKRLDNYLLLFAKSAIDTLSSQKAIKKQSIRAISTLLSEHNMETSLAWTTKTTLDKVYLDDEPLLLTEKAKLLATTTSSAKTSLQLKESEPPIPESTQELLKASLPELIINELKLKSTTLQGLPPHLLLEQNLINLTTYIVSHNPKWQNTPFCVTTHMVENATKHFSVNSTQYERILLTYGINDIIKQLRDT